jgi:hypothetical protein
MKIEVSDNIFPSCFGKPELLNLTQDVVKILDRNENPVVVLEPAWEVKARHSWMDVSEFVTPSGVTVPLWTQGIGKLDGIPEPSPDRFYIVDDDVVMCARVERTIVSDLLTLGEPIWAGETLLGWRKLILHGVLGGPLPVPNHRQDELNLIVLERLVEEYGQDEIVRRFHPDLLLEV